LKTLLKIFKSNFICNK